MTIPDGFRFHHQGWYYKTETGEGPFFVDAQGRPHQGGGKGELITDAWGSQKVSLPYSIFHGLFTFDIPSSQWFMYHDGVQVYSSANITSVDGAGTVTATLAVPEAMLMSRQCPRYQPNRGHLFSCSALLPNKTAGAVREWGLATHENGVFFRLKSDGLLYAVRRDAGVDVAEELIDTSRVPGFNVELGNVYDIQCQWRGTGDYVFFVNLVEVHKFDLLGKLTRLSTENPALPAHISSKYLTGTATIKVGCVDISSENGSNDRLQYGSVYSAITLNGTHKPLAVVSNPLTVGGKTNTRILDLARITLSSDKKTTFKVWVTRDPTAFTGGTLQPLGYGSVVYADSDEAAAGAVHATAMDPAKCRLVTVIPVQANVTKETINPFQDRIDFALVRGDYLIVTATATTAFCESVIEYGEAI